MNRFLNTIITGYDDGELQIKYKTEEIVPEIVDSERIKVLLLFKNPHPDSVQTGLYLSEPYSKTFWNRFFEVKYNDKLNHLLQKDTWIKGVADTLTSGNYNCKFLYYFKCLYPFPSKQFPHLKSLFSLARDTYRREIEERSISDFRKFLKKHGITHVIVFFIDGMRSLASIQSVDSKDAIYAIKRGIDKYLCNESINSFWQFYNGLKAKSLEGITFYFNMNTKTKNHGSHLPKRYFTYNLEFILQDILDDTKKEGHVINAIWFVVHHRNLWDIDNSLIGFWNKEQMDKVSKDDCIIYYRAEYKKIMGVFKACEKGINLNKDFYDDEIVDRLIHQCRIELLSDDVICKRPTTETKFSFFDEWRRNRYGGLKKQIFRAQHDDIKLILRDPTIVR